MPQYLLIVEQANMPYSCPMADKSLEVLRGQGMKYISNGCQRFTLWEQDGVMLRLLETYGAG